MLKWRHIDTTSTQENNPKSDYIQLKKTATGSIPAAAAGNEGGIVYDSTTNTVKFSDGSSWSNIGVAGSAAIADDIYNAGAWTVAADANDVIYTFATGYNMLLNAAAAGTTAAALEINDNTTGTLTDGLLFTAANSIVDAVDASAANITNAINIGANAISGTNFSVTGAGVITSAGITDSGTAALSTMTATTGTVTTLSSTTLNAPTIQAAAAGNTALTIDGAGTGTITIAGTSTGAVTIGQSTTLSSGASLTLTNGDVVLSAGTLDVTAGAGDGDAIDIVNQTGAAAIDLNVTAATTAAQIDIDASTGSGNIIDIAFSGAYTGDAIVANMTNAVGANAIVLTGAGTRTVPLVSITDVPTTGAPTFDLNITPGAAVQAGIDIDVAGTTAADILTINFSAAHTGSAILVDMTNAVAGTALELIGAGTRTQSLIEITDTPEGANGNTIDMNLTPAAGTVACIDIDVAGTDNADVLDIDFSAAYTGDAINITMTNAGAAAQAIVVDGSLANSGAIVDLSTSGISTAAGSVLSCASSTQPAAANVGVCGRFLETGAAQATTYAVQVDSTNNEAINVSTGQCHFAESISVLAGPKFTVAPNFVQAAGAANAITVSLTDDTGTNIALTDGLRLVVDLNTRTLQAGANTLDFNGGGAVSIVSHYNPANNIGTAYTANGIVELVYNGTSSVWMDVSQ